MYYDKDNLLLLQNIFSMTWQKTFGSVTTGLMFCCQFWYFEHGHPCERILYEFNEVSGWVRIVNIEGNNISIRVIINDRKQNHFQHVFLWGKSVESFLLFLPCAKYFSSIFHSHASGLNILNVYL